MTIKIVISLHEGLTEERYEEYNRQIGTIGIQ